MKQIPFLIAASLFFSPVQLIAQNPGSLDTSFNSTGKFTHDYGFQDNITDVKIQPADQKIVVAGTALTPAFSGKLLVARLLPGGGFDSTFNDSGSVIINTFNESYAYETFIKNDGRIVVGGAAADPAFQFSMLVLRLNEDGSLDSTFGTNGMVTPEISTGDDFAYAMTEQPDHKIILAGTALDASFYNAPVVVRLDEDGSIDSTFGTNGVAYITPANTDNELSSIVIQPDGKIVVSGHYDNGLTGGGQFDFDILVARFNSDGTADSTFGTNGVVLTPVSGLVDDAFGLALTPNGNIVVSGFTTQPNFSYDAVLLQYDSTGTLDATFGNNGIVIYDNADMDVSYDVEVQGDGKILMAGNSGAFPPNDNDYLIARYTALGAPDITFGTNGVSITPILSGYDEAEGMALQADGKIVLAGKSRNVNNNDIAVARFTNDLNSALPEITSGASLIVAPNPVSKYQPISVAFESSMNEKVSLHVFDLAGSSVFSKNISAVPGLNRVSLDLPVSIATGMYILKIAGASSLHCKMVVTE